jgi:hypothetical protein
MYVKWNSSKKYHILRLGDRGYRVEDGNVTASRGGGPAFTHCGRDVPADNKAFDILPEGVDRNNDVCYVCQDSKQF